MEQPLLTVTQLNQQVKYLLEESFPTIMVEGEISNFVTPASGHWYFSLKDKNAQVRCAMFKFKNRNVRFVVKNGSHIILKAKVTLYEGRGDFQMVVESMEDAGVGALQRAYNELKIKLEKEGLFKDDHKKSLPVIPKQIGVITSATGAAVRDIIKVLHRRCPMVPMVPIVIYPTLVQGDEASMQIINAIKLANQRKECDILILARGGGSLEDLWAFNDEKLARTIYESELPIIAGVGHQIDFTIADFVADVRAATPSAAAEIVAPNIEEMLDKMQLLTQRLSQQFFHQYQYQAQSFDWLCKRLYQAHPSHQLTLLSTNLLQLNQRLVQSITLSLDKKQNQFAHLMQSLHLISPLATLARGYAIVKNKKTKKIIMKKSDAAINDKISVRVNKADLDCIIETIK